MKVLSLVPALLLSASVAAPVAARPVVNITRGDMTAIRACGDAYAPQDSVCYNRSLTGTVTFRNGRQGSRTVGRARRVNCLVPHPAGTERAALANEFCPAVFSGDLAPAPFL